MGCVVREIDCLYGVLRLVVGFVVFVLVIYCCQVYCVVDMYNVR